MFNISNFNKIDNISFDEAARTIISWGDGSLLEGMKTIEKKYIESSEDHDEFEDGWAWELNCFNVVFEGMSKLLGPKEAA